MYREERLGSADDEALNYTTSLNDDEWIFEPDLLVDKAHLVMLAEEGIVPRSSAADIADALYAVEEEGYEELVGEDVHEAIESRVVDLAGKEGGRLHTARSRNDEVATCLRVATRRDLLRVLAENVEARKRLLDVAEQHLDTLIPAYTHLQRGQPTTLAHHLSAHERRLAREADRVLDALDRVNRCPLGSGAVASTTLPVDRERTAELLGFDAPEENSMDAVAARDFATETLYAAASTTAALSRMAEEVVLWTSTEFGVMELDDSFATTSSVMPQKKNPDVAELVRGRAATVQGHLSAALGNTKGLPMSYNRDLQEFTPYLRDSLRAAAESLRVLSRTYETADYYEPDMELEVGATDLAEALVRNGVPFREAHARIGKLSKRGFGGIDDVADALSDDLDRGEVGEALDFHRSVERRVDGGPGSSRELVETGREDVERHAAELAAWEEKLDSAYTKLEEAISQL